MLNILAQLAAGQTMTESQAYEVFNLIMTGQVTPAQVGAILAITTLRSVTEDELVGAARVMREKVIPVPAPAGMTVIDTCGTGGTQARTFNISTTAALVAAGAGRPRNIGVAKHGNRSVTSVSGSSQVLEAMGMKLNVMPATAAKCLEEGGFCFCHAPIHHPAMKFAAPIRSELKFRTIFNLLGPLTNPAGALRQVLGVADVELVGMMGRVLHRLGAQRAMVLHTELPGDLAPEGLGEFVGLPPGGVTHFARLDKDRLDEGVMGLARDQQPAPQGTAEDFKSMWVSDVAESKAMVMEVLGGARGPARLTVVYNAAMALWVGGIDNFQECLDLATQSIDSGAAQKTLETVIRITQADPSK